MKSGFVNKTRFADAAQGGRFYPTLTFSLVVCTEFDESLCCRIKEQIQNRLCAPFDIDGKTLYVGSSCGYAAYPNDASTANEIRILADQRMYTEKEKHHMFSSLSSSSTGSGLEK